MADKLYYCKRCKNSNPAMVDEKNQEKHRKFSETFTGRFLTCQHAVNINDLPVSYGSDTKLVDDTPNPLELRELNVKVTLEYLRMNEEQRANFVAFHIAQYQMHKKAAKEAKYVIQVLEEETDKYIKAMGIEKGEDEEKRIRQKFDYLWKRPEKRLEVIAKEKVKEENNKEKSKKKIDDQMEKLRQMMRGLKKGD